MLARAFKTASELGLLEHEYAALVEVLYRIEDGTISLSRIRMSKFKSHCGTAYCLAGWANHIDNTCFPELNEVLPGASLDGKIAIQLTDRLPEALRDLFGLNFSRYVGATPTQARNALRAYLETGKVP